MKNVILIASLAVFFQGCQWFSSNEEKQGEPLARVSDYYLYKSDVAGLGAGLPPEDSAAWVKQYVDQWVADRLLAKEAEEQLDMDEIDRLVASYRQSLLINRYKNQWIEQKVPVTVSQEDLDSAYTLLKDNFILEHPAVKMQFVLLDSANASYVPDILQKLNTGNTQSLNEVLEMVSLHALDWKLQGSEWMELSPEIVWLPKANAARVSPSFKVYSNAQQNTHLIYKILAMEDVGMAAPLPLRQESLEKMILQNRKQDFLKRLQKQAFEQATINNEVEIFID